MKNFLKNFLNEFKEFALKGNVMSMAIGVIIGGAFQSIVTAFTDYVINPIIQRITGMQIGEGKIGGEIPLGGGNSIKYGEFLTAVINFLIMAFVLFLLVKGINKLTSIGKKEEEAAPTTKICPFCKSEIDIEATRCPHCTSVIEEVNAEE